MSEPEKKPVGCANCPFRDEAKRLSGETDEQMREIIRQNYETNKFGCRETWPDWKPGLCHTGKRPCAGYAE